MFGKGASRLRRALLCGAALSAGLASHAAAQDTSQTDEIVVTATPLRDSAARALELQRESDRVTTIVASDAIGRFPDQNSAAALARIPGIAVQRDQGQERYIQLRGAPNRWTSVAFDGVPLIGADEGGLERGFRFDAVPAVLLDRIEVNKSLTPDLPADAVVGQIDLITSSALARRGFAIQGEGALGEMELGGGVQQQAAARVSWSNQTLGFVLGASHYLREQITDNREAAYDDLGPTEYSFRNYQLERENNALIGAIEFEPSPQHRFSLKSLYTEFLDQEDRNQYDFNLGSALSGVRSFESGDLLAVPYRGTFQRGQYETSNTSHTLAGEHDISDWEIAWRVNYTETESTTFLPLTLQIGTGLDQLVAVRYDASDPNLPIFDLASTVLGAGGLERGAELNALPQSEFGLTLAILIDTSVVTEAMTYGLDFDRDITLGDRDVRLSFGLLYQDRDVDGGTLSIPTTVAISPFLDAIGESFDAADYVTDAPWDSGFPRGFDVNYIDTARLTADQQRILSALAEAGFYDPDARDPTGAYEIAESVFSTYAMGEFSLGAFDIVAGVRVESSDLDIAGVISDGADGFTPLNVSRSDTEVFPSINVKTELTEDLIARAAYVTGIARPSFGSIRTGASIDDTSTPGSVNGGNPFLEPELTQGIDLSLEWYFAPASVLSGSIFYRNVENVLFSTTETITDDRYDTEGADRTGYEYNSFQNGRDGDLYGLEINYIQQWDFLPAPFNGFGFQGNLTLLDGEFTTRDGEKARFPGTSDTIVNAAVFYEQYGVTARLSYQWRDDWVDGLNLTGDDTFRAATESLDATIRYGITDRVSVFAEANNLTDETYIAYSGDESRPIEVEQVGRRFLGGVRFNF